MVFELSPDGLFQHSWVLAAKKTEIGSLRAFSLRVLSCTDMGNHRGFRDVAILTGCLLAAMETSNLRHLGTMAWCLFCLCRMSQSPGIDARLQSRGGRWVFGRAESVFQWLDQCPSEVVPRPPDLPALASQDSCANARSSDPEISIRGSVVTSLCPEQ